MLTTQPQATLRALLACDETVDDIALSGATLEDAIGRLIEFPSHEEIAA